MYSPLLAGLLALALHQTDATLSELLVRGMQQTDTTVSVQPNARLELENFDGSIVVRTWDRSQVRVRATHGRRDWIGISSGPTVVRIEAESRTGLARGVDYELTVPATMNLDLSGTYTSVDVEGTQGEISAETVQGDVFVNGGTGRIRLESVQGRIVLSNARGRVDVSTINQGIHVSNVTGDVTAETVNGPIIFEHVQATTIEAATVNGTIVYDGTIRNGGRYLLSTHNGGIWLVVPEGSNAAINVATFNGKLDASFPVSLKQSSSRRRFVFVLGNGGARIDLETFGGDVRLRRPGEPRPTFPGINSRARNQ